MLQTLREELLLLPVGHPAVFKQFYASFCGSCLAYHFTYLSLRVSWWYQKQLLINYLVLLIFQFVDLLSFFVLIVMDTQSSEVSSLLLIDLHIVCT